MCLNSSRSPRKAPPQLSSFVPALAHAEVSNTSVLRKVNVSAMQLEQVDPGAAGSSALWADSTSEILGKLLKLLGPHFPHLNNGMIIVVTILQAVVRIK